MVNDAIARQFTGELMSANMSEDFAKYLSSKNYIAGDLISKFELQNAPNSSQSLRRLWELTDLSANDFADEVARFHAIPRIGLAQLMEASALVGRFSHRFLREMMVFPYEMPDGRFVLAVADPNDVAPIRAAEIVLGGDVGVIIASFEDIATVLTARIGDDDRALPEAADAGSAHADDDIENLRDLASGAPIVRAVNDLLEKAMELRASDIHIEPFRTGLVVRMRVDGLLRAVAAPVGGSAAGLDFAHQDYFGLEHRGTPPAAGRRRSTSRRPLGNRYPRCDHAHPARRVGRHQVIAA